MGKILIIVSIVVSAATAGIGFLNKGKISEANGKVEAAEASATTAKADLTKAQATLKTTSENLATVTTERDQLNSQITSAKADLDKATADLAAATTAKTTAETRTTELTTENETLKKQIADAATSAQTPAAPETSAEDKARITELETVNATVQKELDAARGQLETLVKQNQDRAQMKMRDGLEGRILAVNPAWNFVVLNLGDKNGVLNNAEMLVKRGNQFIGKIRVTSVEPSTSIADIVANSVPEGTSISPGDNVIFQAVEE
jgi:multidrug efflux pump subunit AcrA (membrane-fusion protein)